MDRRRSLEGNKNYHIEELWESHNEICRRLALGQKAVDVAREMNISPQTVSNVRNNPLARARIDALMEARDKEVEDIVMTVRAMAPTALEVLQRTMEVGMSGDLQEKDSRKDAISAAKEILGHAIPKKVEAEVLHGHLTLEQIERMKAAAAEERRSQEQEIQAEVEVINA